MAKVKKPAELIISKSRTKGAAKTCNVSGEFYGALDKVVRGMIKDADMLIRQVADIDTLKPCDL